MLDNNCFIVRLRLTAAVAAFVLCFVGSNELLCCIIFSSMFAVQPSIVLSSGGALLPTNDNQSKLPFRENEGGANCIKANADLETAPPLIVFRDLS